MKRTFYYSLILFSGLLLATVTSCKKETPDTETQSSVDNAICEGEFNSRMPLVNSIAIAHQGIKSAGYSIDSSLGWPRTITLDYGVDGIQDTVEGDSRIRKGKIRVTFDTLWHVIGATATISLDTYYVAKSASSPFIQYAATNIEIKHTGVGTYTYKVIDGYCDGDGWHLWWESNRTVTQTEGLSTEDNSDDVFMEEGSTTGTDRNGKSYKVNITQPIYKRTSCEWMESGRLDLTPAGLPTRTIDYGNGTCDNKASLTIDGNTFTFNLN